MDIVERFDCENIGDLLAYELLLNTGVWPEGYTDGVEIRPTWQIEIANKIATHFLKEQLDDLRELGLL